MRFLKSILEEGEKPLCHSRLHGIYLVTGLFWFVAIAAFGWFIDFYLWVNWGEYIPPYEMNNQFFHVALAPGMIGLFFTTAGALIFLVHFFMFISTKIVVTNRRFFYKTGYINVKMDITEISDILGVHVDQGWFGQFFGYGRIRLDCRFIEDVLVPYAKNPYGITKIVQKAKAELAHLTPPAPMDEEGVKVKSPRKPQVIKQTLIQISGNNPVYIIDGVPQDPKTPLIQLPKALGDNLMKTFRNKA